MADLLSLIVRHGYAVIFLIVFAEAIGMPVPAALALVAGGAAAASGNSTRSNRIAAGNRGDAFGRLTPLHSGKLYRLGFVGFLCKVSTNPETCILRSAESFYKRGRATLVMPSSFPA